MPLYEYQGVAPALPADGSAWVAPSAELIGDVRLGREASVWFGAVIRADNTSIILGDRTNVQENAVLHSDLDDPLTIGADCTIGHQAVLHGCTLGDRVLVGIGATVLNGAMIADDCLIGAGALVTEGKKFPSGSLIVGVPARLVRPLDTEQRAALLRSASGYVANARRFAASLKRID